MNVKWDQYFLSSECWKIWQQNSCRMKLREDKLLFVLEFCRNTFSCLIPKRIDTTTVTEDKVCGLHFTAKWHFWEIAALAPWFVYLLVDVLQKCIKRSNWFGLWIGKIKILSHFLQDNKKNWSTFFPNHLDLIIGIRKPSGITDFFQVRMCSSFGLLEGSAMPNAPLAGQLQSGAAVSGWKTLSLTSNLSRSHLWLPVHPGEQ